MSQVGEALLTMFDSQHNEFWNNVTAFLPAAFFAWGALHLGIWPPAWFAALPAHMRIAFIVSHVAVSLQHCTSLVAHTFNCISARVSHVIW